MQGYANVLFDREPIRAAAIVFAESKQRACELLNQELSWYTNAPVANSRQFFPIQEQAPIECVFMINTRENIDRLEREFDRFLGINTE